VYNIEHFRSIFSTPRENPHQIDASIYEPCRHVIFAADTVNHEISTFNDDFRKMLTEIVIKNEDCMILKS